MIGRTLSHFEITGRLGAGGMGEVYLARDTRLERDVALKVLPAEVAEDPARLKRLVREARALAALDHPHIVTVFSVEEDAGVHFLTMAYVRGRSLDALIPEGGLGVEELLDFAVPLADALRAAHERGIVHRDLKPANVMVDDEGRLRVLDFGLAKRDSPVGAEMSQLSTRGLSEQMTRQGTILGSYPYMSPEQAEGREVDGRSDLFSLGILLYEMACGRRPFEGETGIGLITAILRDEPAPLAARRPGVPRRLVEIVERCLQKEPDDRYATAAELRDELAALRESLRRGGVEAAVAQAATVELEPRPAAPPGRSSHLRQLALAIVIVASALGGSWLWLDSRPPREDARASTGISSIAVLPLANLAGDPAQDYLVDGMTEALITDLSKIGALKVISRSSVMRYKGTDTPAPEIAAELGVDAVLEGSLIREGDRVGVTANLIEAGSATSLWADRFERDMTGILSLQAEIATRIAGEIRIALTPDEQRQLGAARAVDPKAYEAYLKGTFHLQKFTPKDFELALQYFEAALALDPDYALAHVGVSSVWGFRNQFGLIRPLEAGPRMVAALERALAIDPSLPEAIFGRAAWKAWHEFDWEGADADFRRALELNPNYADARIFYSHLLAILGRVEESDAQVAKALELDPLNPFFQGLYGIQLSMTRPVEAAIRQLRRTHEMAPGFDFGREAVAEMLFLTGDEQGSLEEYRTVYGNIGDGEMVEALDGGWAANGYRGAMRRAAELLAARARDEWIQPSAVSVYYESAGDYARALEWLERAYAEHDPDLPYWAAMPCTEELRSLPGFQDLLQRLGLRDVHDRA